jgi:hypothetical protein
LRVVVRGQRALADHDALAVDHRELRQGGPALQVVLISPRTVRLQVAARVCAGAPEQDHAALHRYLCFL